MKKRLTGLIIFSVLILCGCSKNKNQKNSGGTKTQTIVPHVTTIGFSIDTLAIERWQRDLDVFINKAKELQANVIVQNAGNSLEEQSRQLIYLMERNVDVIVVLPKEADGLSETLQKVSSKGIPIISYDRLALNSNIDMYITIDSAKVGELMGRGLQSHAKGRNWCCILGPEEDYNMTFIKQGLYKSLKGSPYHITHVFHADGWNYDLAHQEMVRILSEEEIPDAIVCGNDAIADSVIQALGTYYNGPHIPICGQDADIAACQNITKGLQDFTIYKPITKLAELSAEIAVKIAKGSSAEEIANFQTINNNLKEVPVVWLEPTYVDASNIDSIIIDSGFHTRQEVYTQAAN